VRFVGGIVWLGCDFERCDVVYDSGGEVFGLYNKYIKKIIYIEE
jgi:hypothetical protein